MDTGDVAVCRQEEEFIRAHRSEVWNLRAQVRAMTAKRKQREALPTVDGDDEPMNEGPDVPYEDDDDEQETTTCRGKGRDHSGRTCKQCGGSGRVPIGPDDDDEDDEVSGRFYEPKFEDEE
jgi:hypothetical protein